MLFGLDVIECGMFDKIRERFGSDSDEFEGCRAVVDEESGELCGEDAFGWNGSKTIIYCESHMPSEAHHQFNRVDPVTFYIPETDEFVEKN